MTSLFKSYKAVTHKVLAPVDLPHAGSNQHELNGVSSLKDFFGTSERVKGEIFWTYYIDGLEPQYSQGGFTFYDARENHPVRSEWRLFYQGDFLSRASPGDVLVITRDLNDRVNGLLFRRESSWLRAAVRFFKIDLDFPEFRTIADRGLSVTEFAPEDRWIAEDLQLELPFAPAENDEELVRGRFGDAFPTSTEMSFFAREQSADYITDPDKTLISWLDREEQLFLALESSIVEPRISDGFVDVEDFIQYSLSVQNRRKSRMGLSFQNQLGALFDCLQVSYTPEPITEDNHKPDFIFPSIESYKNPEFDSSRLTMLGAKSSCKERWRQILTEADRIPDKHLCTLDQTIATSQMEEMHAQHVTLVIPSPLNEIYGDRKPEILSIGNFIQLVKEREGNLMDN